MVGEGNGNPTPVFLPVLERNKSLLRIKQVSPSTQETVPPPRALKARNQEEGRVA